MGVIKNKKWFFIFLLPGLLFYILSVFYPIEESIRLSFMEWNFCRSAKLCYNVS